MPAQEQQEPNGRNAVTMPAQEQQEPDGIIERVLKAHSDDKTLVDFKKDPEHKKDPKFTFYVYKLKIEEIFNLLRDDTKLREFPPKSLEEYETDLNEMAGGFYNLYGKPGFGTLSLKDTQVLIDEASTQLSTAIDYQGEKKMEMYLRHLKNCRGQLFLLQGQLEAVRFDDKTKS
jgi:hypothetical protein